MQPKRSPRHPSLLVYTDGRVFDTLRDKFLTHVEPTDNLTNGPVVNWTYNKRSYRVSVYRLVYEAFVLGDIAKKGLTIYLEDGKEIAPENLKTRHHKEKLYDVKERSTCSTWMNGDAELFMW